MAEVGSNEDVVPPEVEALHPFVVSVCAHLVPGTDGERFSLAEDTIYDLYDGLLAYAGEDELLHIVHGLGAMMVAMRDELNSPSLAAQIMEILEADEVEAAFAQIKIASSPEKLAEAAKRFSTFAGAQSAKAPAVNEPRPEGTLTLDAMKFPKRL